MIWRISRARLSRVKYRKILCGTRLNAELLAILDAPDKPHMDQAFALQHLC
jgi:hypothetical protein